MNGKGSEMRNLQNKTSAKTVKVFQGPDFASLKAKQDLRKAVREELRQHVKDSAQTQAAQEQKK